MNDSFTESENLLDRRSRSGSRVTVAWSSERRESSLVETDLVIGAFKCVFSERGPDVDSLDSWLTVGAFVFRCLALFWGVDPSLSSTTVSERVPSWIYFTSICFRREHLSCLLSSPSLLTD